MSGVQKDGIKTRSGQLTVRERGLVCDFADCDESDYMSYLLGI